MFYPVIWWKPADALPFDDCKEHNAKPFRTMKEAKAYAQRVIERAKSSDVWLQDIAVFNGKPRKTVIDHENSRVHDYATWRLHGRQTYRGMFY